MASSSSSSSYLIRFHRGGFLKNDEDLAKCVELGAKNDNVLDIYVSHTVFDFFDATSSSQQHVGNAKHNDDSDSDLDDVFVYDSESEESETVSVDHLPDGEEEVYDVRTRKPDTAPKKMFDANFLSYAFAEHRQCARHIYANFRKKYTGVQYRNLFWKAAKATYPTRFNKVMKEIQSINKEAYKHLMDRQPESWSRAYFSTDKACDAVENGISECFNAIIVDARRKPIINMLEDIKLEKYKDIHRHWNVIPSGESMFEVRNGYEGFKVDERSRTCSCRGWQLSGIPCERGIAAIYFLHKDLKIMCLTGITMIFFVNAYNHYIERMNGMDQWPTTDYQKPLPPIVRRMPGRPPHKRKRNAMEDDGNKTRIRTASVGQVSATGEIVSASVGKVTAAGEIVSASGGNMTASGGIMTARDGNVTARGGKVTARGGKVSAIGGKVTARGRIVMENRGNVSARGGKVTASRGKVTAKGGKVSAKGGNTASSVVRTNGGAIKLREGVWIRSPEKERSSYADYGSSSMNKLRTVNGKVVSSRGRGDESKSIMYPFGIRPIGFGASWDPTDGQTMLGNSMGLPRHAWPEGITPQDCIIHAATQSEITLSQSQPVESQEKQPRQQEPRVDEGKVFANPGFDN
ncbi:multidrug resistance-associated protein 5 [Tanacetum coccineum]